jgi:hypothetical protein
VYKRQAGAAVVVELPQHIERFVEPLQTAIFAQETLVKLSKAAAAVTDGEGCQRVVEHLLKGVHG